ncbi:hypothetical protein GBF38_016643 [Nibea albiflora]|uniref:Uncharacterized protein n=1 Tax=Nibea albiflora TaxID=240163 RepID=A0ACB7ERU5_NIBAL|nr:hypothetical protein GBF38_016643 [Nibea albiflora]
MKPLRDAHECTMKPPTRFTKRRKRHDVTLIWCHYRSYNYSTRGSNHREAEEDTIFSWEMVLLNMIEDKVTELRFEDLLIFVTGADEVPALGFPRKPRIDFYEQEAGRRRLPYASTCAMCLYLPRGITEEDKLHEMLFQATRDSLGFGKV